MRPCLYLSHSQGSSHWSGYCSQRMLQHLCWPHSLGSSRSSDCCSSQIQKSICVSHPSGSSHWTDCCSYRMHMRLSLSHYPESSHWSGCCSQRMRRCLCWSHHPQRPQTLCLIYCPSRVRCWDKNLSFPRCLRWSGSLHCPGSRSGSYRRYRRQQHRLQTLPSS